MLKGERRSHDVEFGKRVPKRAAVALFNTNHTLSAISSCKLSDMSPTSTPNDSPIATPIQPLHNPSQAAHIVVPSAPLGNVVNQAPGMGAKALLAKKMARSQSVVAVQISMVADPDIRLATPPSSHPRTI